MMCKYGVVFEWFGVVYVDGLMVEIELVDMIEVYRFGDVEIVGKFGVVSMRECYDKFFRLLYCVYDFDVMIY